MYYYKEIENGIMTFCSSSSPVVDKEMISEEEYLEAIQKLEAQEETEVDMPTYEELEEENAKLLYKLLTGEEL